MGDDQDGFIDSTRLTTLTRWSLYAMIAVSIVALVSGALEAALLEAFSTGSYASEADAMSDANLNDARQRIVGIAQIIISITSGILVLRWIYRANFNARELGADGMEFSPGWSIGWYFIPVASLWKPYQAMKEIWRASASPAHWEAQEVSPLLFWWWLLWIFSNILAQASFRIALRAEELHELILGNIVTIASDLIDLPLCVILLMIIGQIHTMQMAQHQARTTFD